MVKKIISTALKIIIVKGSGNNFIWLSYAPSESYNQTLSLATSLCSYPMCHNSFRVNNATVRRPKRNRFVVERVACNISRTIRALSSAVLCSSLGNLQSQFDRSIPSRNSLQQFSSAPWGGQAQSCRQSSAAIRFSPEIHLGSGHTGMITAITLTLSETLSRYLVEYSKQV